MKVPTHLSSAHRIVKRKTRSAFTLMEMILVIAIIAMLAGGGIYMMVNVLGDAEEGRVGTDLQALSASLIRYKTKGGIYPTTEQGLDALATRPTIDPQPRAYKPLVKADSLIDPWGNPYQYRKPGEKNTDTYDIFSMGPDGKAGTDDDIGNW